MLEALTLRTRGIQNQALMLARPVRRGRSCVKYDSLFFLQCIFLGLFLGVFGLGLAACSDSEPREQLVGSKDGETLRIGFGSCADDDAPDHPVWQSILNADPDAFVMMGDNVYADTPEFKASPSVEKMQAEYAKLAATPGFAELRATRSVFATWDDHDFGKNDGGAEFEFKDQAAGIFLDFWEFPANDPARSRPGVYSERRVSLNNIDVQLLLLDTRTFRGPLAGAGRTLGCPLKNYEINTEDPFLGEAQWSWLQERLTEKADLRLIISGQQVIADQHCFEKWGNFPHERARLFKVLRETGASNAILLSGDRHLGEISKMPANNPDGAGFDVYEVTASPLSARSGFGWGETNDYRVSEDNLRESQFGTLDIARGPTGVHVSMQLHDDRGAVRFAQRVEFASAEPR